MKLADQAPISTLKPKPEEATPQHDRRKSKVDNLKINIPPKQPPNEEKPSMSSKPPMKLKGY